MKNKLLIILAILVVSLCLLTSCVTYTFEKEAVKIAVNSFSNYELYQGDELSFKDASILVTFNDGSTDTLPLTADMVSGYSKNTVGPATLTIKYKKLTTTVDVEVKPLVIQRIAVNEAPDEITVVQGGTLDITGVSLKIYYQNKTSVLEKITNDMITGFSSALTPGDHIVYINLAGYTAPLPITVVEKAITDIAVTTNPTINSYFIGNEFNPAGMAITLTYNNDTTEVVYYTSQTEKDFEFEYDFSFALTSSPVTVKYQGKYSTIHYLVVATPICTNLEFSFTQDVENEITHEISKKTFSYYPRSYGVYIDGIRQTPNEITALIEGDTIDWNSGKARLSFDDGTTRLISLSDNSINVQFENADKEIVSYKDHKYTEAGNYTLLVSYGNMSKSTPLYVTVKEKRAIRLSLYNTESVTQKFNGTAYEDRIYHEGDKVITDLVRYNLLYDNGTYLCDNTKPSEWKEVTVEMLDDSSDFNITYSYPGKDTQRIGFEISGVTAYIDVKIAPIAIESADCELEAPDQNVVLTGNFPSLKGGSLFVQYNNGTSEFVDLTSDMVSYSNTLGQKVMGFDTEGTYFCTVVYTGKSQSNSFVASYSFTVKDVVVDAVSIANPPAKTMEFDNFASVNFDGLYFDVTYSDPDVSTDYPDIYPATVAVEMKYLYRYDKYNVGYQEVYFRYGGKLTSGFPIKIKGRNETYIEVKHAPTKVVYDIGEKFDLSGLVVNKYYSDGTFVDVSDFSGSRWVFTYDGNTTIGQKKLGITYMSLDGGVVGETIYVSYEVNGAVKSISIDGAQSQFSDYVTLDGTIRVLRVTKNATLNTTGIKLHVVYENTDGLGVNYSSDIDLDSSYVSYDKTLIAPSETRELEVRYGGKTTTMWIYVLARQLTSISVSKLPTISIYADGQKLNLEGGEIVRNFSDGTSDVLPMRSGLIEHNYNANFFDTFVSNDRAVTQTVTVTYGGCTATMDIMTYRRVTAEDIISYSDTVSFYGNVKTPMISMTTGIEHFEAPEWKLYYKVNNAWVETRPSVPGSYPLKVEVFDNEYYQGSIIENQKMVIIEKIIEIRAHDVSKTYGEDDPELTYEIEGDGVDGEGNYINTVLVWNTNENGERVQDKIEIKLVRESGENVKLDGSVVKGYTITYELVKGDNQNNRYRIDFRSGDFKIEQMEITENVVFSGWQNLVYNGTPKIITASFSRNGSNVIIEESNTAYYRYDGGTYVLMDSAPVEAGIYRMCISDNYKIIGSNSYCDFSINANI